MFLEYALPIGIALVILTVVIALLLRRVVEPNEVHIVQSAMGRKSYGKDGAKNTYYEWPAWLPVIGVTKSILPVSVFDLELKGYAGYDRDRVPFVVDIMAFFRIEDTNLAAQRVENIAELKDQLLKVMQGAVRSVLASEQIDTIMLERSTFGEKFTKEVESQLEQWGVKPVKNMELIDIQDGPDSLVIHNIMAKKKSHIEMESRREVAENNKLAEIAEIENARESDVAGEKARQEVAERKAEADKGEGVANEIAKQEIKAQAKITMEKDIAVLKVDEVGKAQIRKEVEVVDAQQDKETTIIKADGELEAEKKNAEGIIAVGDADAKAKTAILLAPVTAEITLAEKIAQLTEYQNYLVNIKKVDANKEVGIATASALEDADLKVIANSGDVTGGVNTMLDLFTPKGGTSAAAAIEAFAQTDHGKALLDKFGITPEEAQEFVMPKVVNKKPKPAPKAE